MGTLANPPPPDPPSPEDSYGLARLTTLWFLGLAAIYLLYGWTALHRIAGHTTPLERVEMVLGPSMFAFALLVSPSLYAAGLAQVSGFDRNPGRVLDSRWAVLVLLAGMAYLLSAAGPAIVSSLLSSVPEGPLGASATPRPPANELARHLIPVSLAVFVPISGTAGTLIGHVTSAWQPLRRDIARWISGIALMASFLLPFLATANAIALQGTSPIWIIVNPLALPLVLTAALAVRERDTIGLRVGGWWRPVSTNRLDPELLDRIVTGVTEDPGSRIDPRSLTGPEREMATLATMIRSIAGPRATLPESQVREIVTAIIKASPATTPEAARPRWSWLEPSFLGGFCTSWTCLAVGLVIVSPLGGVPISVATAAVVGFLGSAGILLVARRFPGLASAVAS